LSGINKIITFEATVNSFKKRFIQDLPQNFYVLAIILVIILEIFAPLKIMYSLHTKKYRKYAYYSCLALAVFTVLAILIYHFPPEGAKYYPFMSNVTSFGALLLLSTYFKD